MLLLVSEHNLFVRFSFLNQICQTFKLESWQEFLPYPTPDAVLLAASAAAGSGGIFRLPNWP